MELLLLSVGLLAVGMLWAKNGGIVAKKGSIVSCDECPCDEEIPVCDYLIPLSFDIQMQAVTNGSCANCATLEQRVPVTYQGRVTDDMFNPGGPSQVEWHWWKSEDDVFNSPGSCGGIFDDKVYHVFIPTGKEPLWGWNECDIVIRFMETNDNKFEDISNHLKSITADFGDFLYALPNNGGESFDVRGQGWFNTGHCDPNATGESPPRDRTYVRVHVPENPQ